MMTPATKRLFAIWTLILTLGACAGARRDAGTPLTPPAVFIGGQYDVGTTWGAEALARAPEVMPNYCGTHMVPDVGHWIQQEAPEETNRLLVDFLRGLG